MMKEGRRKIADVCAAVGIPFSLISSVLSLANILILLSVAMSWL